MNRHRIIAAVLGAAACLATLAAPTASFAASCASRNLVQVHDVGTSTTTFAINFTGLSGTGPGGCTYRGIRIIGQARFQDPNSFNGEMSMQLGSGGVIDNGHNYEQVLLDAYSTGGAIPSFYAATAADGVLDGYFPYSGLSAYYAGSVDLNFPNAFDTTFHKHVIGNGSSALGGDVTPFAADWAETAAITNISLYANNTHFAPHSVFYLYEY